MSSHEQDIFELKIKHFSLFLLIPIINVIANVTTNYFTSGTINPGFFRTLFMLGIIVLLFANYKVPFRGMVITILLFLGYHFVLITFNSAFIYALSNYLKFSITFIAIFIGFTIFNGYEKIQLLFKAFIVSLGILCLNYLIANIFNLGGSTYLEDSFYLGGASNGLTNELAVIIIISLAYLMISNNKNWNLYTTIVIMISIIVIVLVLRRGAILTLVAGLIFFVLSIGINRKLFKYFVIGGFGILFLFPVYGNTLMSRLDYRVESRGGSLTNYEIEGRYMELYRVAYEIETKGYKQALFGTHNLNSVNYFGGRELHVGYMALLHGSGIIGFFWFFLILFQLIYHQRKYYKKLKKNHRYNVLNGLFFALIAALLIYMVSSRLHSFSVNIPVFLMLGSILGTMRFEYHNTTQNE